MSYAADLTADLALWIAGLLREMLTDAPPPAQRNTAEWILERLDAVGSAERGGGASPSDNEEVLDPPGSDEPVEGEV